MSFRMSRCCASRSAATPGGVIKLAPSERSDAVGEVDHPANCSLHMRPRAAGVPRSRGSFRLLLRGNRVVDIPEERPLDASAGVGLHGGAERVETAADRQERRRPRHGRMPADALGADVRRADVHVVGARGTVGRRDVRRTHGVHAVALLGGVAVVCHCTTLGAGIAGRTRAAARLDAALVRAGVAVVGAGHRGMRTSAVLADVRGARLGVVLTRSVIRPMRICRAFGGDAVAVLGGVAYTGRRATHDVGGRGRVAAGGLRVTRIDRARIPIIATCVPCERAAGGLRQADSPR